MNPIEEKIRSVIETNIARSGFHIMNVLPGVNTQSLAYTIGISARYRAPEFCVIGLEPQHTNWMLHDLVKRVSSGETFNDKQVVEELVVNTPPILLNVPCNIAEETFPWAFDYGGDIRFMQLVVPDANHHFPWHPMCDPDYVTKQQLFPWEAVQ